MSSHLWKFVILYHLMVKLCSPPGWQTPHLNAKHYIQKKLFALPGAEEDPQICMYMTFTHFCSPASVKMGGSYWGLLLHVSVSEVRRYRWDSVGPQIFKNLLNQAVWSGTGIDEYVYLYKWCWYQFGCTHVIRVGSESWEPLVWTAQLTLRLSGCYLFFLKLLP